MGEKNRIGHRGRRDFEGKHPHDRQIEKKRTQGLLFYINPASNKLSNLKHMGMMGTLKILHQSTAFISDVRE